MRPVVVVFAGEYNVNSKARLHRELGRLSTKPQLVLDFSEVTYVDSTCVAELMRMEQRRMVAGFGNTIIVTQTAVLLRIFNVLALDRIFRVVPSMNDVAGADEGLHVEYAFCGEDASARVPQDYEKARFGSAESVSGSARAASR
ncbi:MAG: STAS domain-containing protein [Candidatus Eremiobacteraeota bacterium]|nr:STAS domain-containing protein [Candidatus Eremiobacteraeota bacterium]MBV8654842.1 STAS domain-containing protein [Candidatus Eremiobacteraeota bacterium]